MCPFTLLLYESMLKLQVDEHLVGEKNENNDKYDKTENFGPDKIGSEMK